MGFSVSWILRYFVDLFSDWQLFWVARQNSASLSLTAPLLEYKSFLLYLKNRCHGNKVFTSFYVKQILCYSVVLWQVNTYRRNGKWLVLFQIFILVSFLLAKVAYHRVLELHQLLVHLFFVLRFLFIMVMWHKWHWLIYLYGSCVYNYYLGHLLVK